MPSAARTREQYAELLSQLLPEGPFWQGFNDTDGLGRDVLAAKATPLAVVDERSMDLLREANPQSVLEMLPARETEAALPDPCAVLPDTIQERVAALVAKWRARGGQDSAFFIEVAKTLGFVVTIKDFTPFRTGMSCAGTPLSGNDWWFTWEVSAPATTFTEFRAGRSAAGEPLRSWGNEILQCVFSKLKPAHTVLLFNFST